MVNLSSRNAIGMPMVGFGTYQCKNDEAKVAVLTALEAGYRHIDTAEAYGNEKGVGQALKEDGIAREDIFITSKVHPGNAAWNKEEKDHDGTLQAGLQSVENLQVEYVDLYLIHAPLSKRYRLEQWMTLLELQKMGKAKHVGVSNYGIKHLKEIEDADLPLPAVNQIELHPLCQQKELLEYMKTKNILPIAYSSLLPLSSWRADSGQGGDETLKARSEHNEKLEAMAKKYDVTPAQILLRWALQHDFPILPKSNKPERIRQNIDLFNFELSDSDMKELDSWDLNKAFAWSSGKPDFDPTRVD